MNTDQLEAYCDWRCFAKAMRETDFSWLESSPSVDRLGGNVNWNQLGIAPFKCEELIQRVFKQCWNHPVAKRIVAKHWRCITVIIMKNNNFPDKDFDTRAFLVRPDLHAYAVIYQSMRFTKYSRNKLETLIRLNHGTQPVLTRHKIGFAVAYNQTRNLGFNVFAVKSKLNDDVLSKIKSFV